jgi:chemotaxis protein MotB
MARKRRQEEHENHERWLVSYADFITLLFAFFVVMYSISSVNDGKYRVLSDTLTDAFLTSAQSLDPIQVGERVRTIEPEAGEFATPEREKLEPPVTDEKVETPEEQQPPGEQQPPPEQPAQEAEKPETPDVEQTIADLRSTLSPFIDKELVNITRSDRGIEVEMKSKMLFESGSARLSRDALQVLRNVAEILRPLPNQILVEGHTDNVPIRTIAFPSNWELSAARAASVVHLFTRQGVDSSRLAAIGYGEFRPVGDNETEEGRQKNRRVALIMMTEQRDRMFRGVDDVQEAPQ